MTYEEMASVLADRLRAARKACNLSVVEAARRAGIDRGAIYRYEEGRTIPNVIVAYGLAELYAVSVEWLIGIEP